MLPVVVGEGAGVDLLDREPAGGAEEVAVFGQDGFQPARALDQLYGFAAKAYRRPLVDADRAPIRQLYEQRLAQQAAPRQAALDALKLILCSPSFLYLSETTPENERDRKSVV